MRVRSKHKTGRLLRKAPLLLVSLASLTLAACGARGTDSRVASPAVAGDIQKFARNVPRIRMTAGIPTKEQLCDMQREHARQEAFLDTIVDGKDTVYQAECDLKPKKKAKQQASS